MLKGEIYSVVGLTADEFVLGELTGYLSVVKPCIGYFFSSTCSLCSLQQVIIMNDMKGDCLRYHLHPFLRHSIQKQKFRPLGGRGVSA